MDKDEDEEEEEEMEEEEEEEEEDSEMGGDGSPLDGPHGPGVMAGLSHDYYPQYHHQHHPQQPPPHHQPPRHPLPPHHPPDPSSHHHLQPQQQQQQHLLNGVVDDAGSLMGVGGDAGGGGGGMMAASSSSSSASALLTLTGKQKKIAGQPVPGRPDMIMGEDGKPRPKKYQNSYMLFCKEERLNVAKDFPEATPIEVARILGSRWRELPAGLKKPYQVHQRWGKDKLGKKGCGAMGKWMSNSRNMANVGETFLLIFL